MAVILVVEDEKDIREGVAEALREEGHEVREAGDGLEALQSLRSGPTPHAILLDLMMPRMDGWQFRAAQLGDPRLAGIPVLVVSAHGGALAAARYLAKPFDLGALLAAVDEVVAMGGAAHA